MKVLLELESHQLADLDRLLRVPDFALFRRVTSGMTIPSDLEADLACRILKARVMFGLSNTFDSSGDSPAVNGICPKMIL